MKPSDFIKENIGQDAEIMATGHVVDTARQACYNTAKNAIELHRMLQNMEAHDVECCVEQLKSASDTIKSVHEQLCMAQQPEPMGMPEFDTGQADAMMGAMMESVTSGNGKMAARLAKKFVKEGKFTVNAKTGAKLDPRTGAALPPKAPKAALPPKAPKMNISAVLEKCWNKVEQVVANIYPDGDPIDYLGPWARQHNIPYEMVNRACRKNGFKDIYDYWDSMSEHQGVAEGMDGDLGIYMGAKVFHREHQDGEPFTVTRIVDDMRVRVVDDFGNAKTMFIHQLVPASGMNEEDAWHGDAGQGGMVNGEGGALNGLQAEGQLDELSSETRKSYIGLANKSRQDATDQMQKSGSFDSKLADKMGNRAAMTMRQANKINNPVAQAVDEQEEDMSENDAYYNARNGIEYGMGRSKGPESSSWNPKAGTREVDARRAPIKNKLPADPFGRTTGKIPAGKAGSRHGMRGDTDDLDENSGQQFGVFRKGGAIGDKNGSEPVKTFSSKEEAMACAKRYNSLLSTGERKYYGLGYGVKPINENASAGGTSAGAVATGPAVKEEGKGKKPGNGVPKIGNKVKTQKITLGKGIY